MKKKKIKRVSVLALSLVMAFSLTSLPVYAADGIAGLTINSSKVAFANYEWWVIGYNEEGVYPQTGHITLLSANNYFGTTTFRASGSDDGYTQYNDGNLNYYYADNPDGMERWTTPNEYAGSTLQQRMEEIADSFSEKELTLITARDLATDDGINGQSISNQKLWALSEEEWDTINDITVRAYGYYEYWLRSPYSDSGYSVQLGSFDGYSMGSGDVFYNYIVARPAFSLNLESVIFTSAASEASGKSLATVGNGFTSMGTISSSSTVKFTMKDDSQTLTVDVKEQVNETLEFTYSGATIGENQYVSCVLTDSDGNVAYYAKLVDCEEEDAANGSLSISLEGVAEGTYTLKIFSEEANGNSYTDFCSEPVTATLAVEGGVGTVSEFDGEITGSDSGTGTTDSDSSISTTGTTSTGSTTGTADTDSTPETGDNSTFALWIAIMLMTGAGLTSSLVFLRKHR